MKLREIMKALSLLTQIGLAMFVPIFGCILIGSYLDKLFKTNVIFLLIFTILGVLSAFRTLYVMTMHYFKK